jgi:ethanolamine ammonia-lyase small subunit
MNGHLTPYHQAHSSSLSRPEDLQALVQSVTPARLLKGRVGPGYLTRTQLELRSDHAAAQDAVLGEFQMDQDFPAELITRRALFEVQTQARSKSEYLLRPDLGRILGTDAEQTLKSRCQTGAELQIVIGDGLSAAATRRQVPALLPELFKSATTQGWLLGQTFCIRYCRVGVLNEVGRILRPKVAVLLIGERPGLATAESLSAYLAFEPQPGQTDAHRNLVSNIHSRGISVTEAATRILSLASQIRHHQISGPTIKERSPVGKELQAIKVA